MALPREKKEGKEGKENGVRDTEEEEGVSGETERRIET